MIFSIMSSVWSILMPYLLWIMLMLRSFSLSLLGRYSQRECQLLVLVFQIILCSLLPWWFHMFQHQGMICNSCRPMRIQHYQRSLCSLLQWWIFVLVSYTRTFHLVLYLELNSLTKCIIPSGFLSLMEILAIFFGNNPDIYIII